MTNKPKGLLIHYTRHCKIKSPVIPSLPLPVIACFPLALSAYSAEVASGYVGRAPGERVITEVIF